uniref:Glycosyltransferase n=1 Tax=viral metagenome TaxID=1070528 RepID=A0A6C0K3L6_9ZZZZ
MTTVTTGTSLYLYRTHLWDDMRRSMYQKMQHDLGVENVYLLFDNTGNRFEGTLESNMILFTMEDCWKINRLHRCNKRQIEAQLLLFEERCGERKYDYLWLIEYDVACDGNWKVALNKVSTREEDFLATVVCSYAERMLWNGWFQLSGPRWLKPPLAQRVCSFFPVVRFSRQLIETLRENCGRYSGFCEVFVPTLAFEKGLKCGNLPQEMLGDYFTYEETPRSRENAFVLETPRQDDRLYHPILYPEQGFINRSS